MQEKERRLRELNSNNMKRFIDEKRRRTPIINSGITQTKERALGEYNKRGDHLSNRRRKKENKLHFIYNKLF